MAQSIQETELDLAANSIASNCRLNLLVIPLGREELAQNDFDLVFAPGSFPKWGSCSASAGTIRLNSELAKKPRECLEYIVVHEMVHLLERTHNRRFMSLIEQFMPRWQSDRDLLNRLPVRGEKWVY